MKMFISLRCCSFLLAFPPAPRPPLQMWNDNTRDKKPAPDVLVGKGHLPVKNLSIASDDPIIIGGSGRKGGAGAGAEEEAGTGGEVVTVRLLPAGKWRRRKGKHAGLVSLKLLYTSPRYTWYLVRPVIYLVLFFFLVLLFFYRVYVRTVPCLFFWCYLICK